MSAAAFTLDQLIVRWRAAPWLFVREALAATPDAWQDECLHAIIESGFTKFALKACKGPGKSTLLAWVILWFLMCFAHPKVLVTSITGENLADGLWAEIAKWRNNCQLAQVLFEMQSDRIYARDHKDTWFCSARTWPKDADKTKQANTLAGLHAVNTLIVLDEAGDIPEGVLAAGLAHHSTQGDEPETHLTFLAGNPTRLDGALGVACTRDRGDYWVKEITGDPDDPKRAPRIDVAWARGEMAKWGADHDWVRINVYGQFPRTQDSRLLGPDIVRAAMSITFPERAWQDEPKIMGLDVARSVASDRSSLCRRQGKVVFPFKKYRIDDLMELVSQVAWEWSQWKAVAIFVDMTGLGSGVYDRLRQLGLPAIGVGFGNKARDQRFADKRSEMWWDMHVAVKGEGGKPALALPLDPELIADLTGPEITFDIRGKLRLESKESLKKRGLKSPDGGDSLALTFADPVFADSQLPDSVQAAVNEVTRAKVDYDPFAWRE